MTIGSCRKTNRPSNARMDKAVVYEDVPWEGSYNLLFPSWCWEYGSYDDSLRYIYIFRSDRMNKISVLIQRVVIVALCDPV